MEEVTAATTVIVQELDPDVVTTIVEALYHAFCLDLALIGFSVVGSISAFATFWALRGR